MYRVISPFRDLKNNEHLYDVGDIYPVEGYKPTKARIKELAEGKNPLNRVFIEEIKEAPETGKESVSDPDNGENEPVPETGENKVDE
jgi:hypothetical protein|nr:MAG TPA: hypothetical protein [Caudoviricetes sp.]